MNNHRKIKNNFGKKNEIAGFLAVSVFFLFLIFLAQGQFTNSNLGDKFDENAADIAELFPAAYPLEAGDVVCINETGKAVHCNEELDIKLLGIVSTNPALILKGDHLVTGWESNSLEVPIALKGRVPVKVSCNVSIAYGDLLTSSDKKGYAIKKDLGRLNIIERIERMDGTTLGKALENCESGEEKIMVWID